LFKNTQHHETIGDVDDEPGGSSTERESVKKLSRKNSKAAILSDLIASSSRHKVFS
jgi:hypothetical protein